MRSILLIAAAVAVAGCSSSTSTSTGPSDPIVGNWRVSLPAFADSSYFAPSPFTLSIAKGAGGGYTATYPSLVYHETPSVVIDTYTAGRDSSTFSASGTAFTLRVGAPVALCVLTIQGTTAGSTAAGTFGVRFGCGPSPADNGAWTAVKQ